MLICLLLVAVGAPVYVMPQIDPLRRADAIVVLGGHDYERYAFGLGLALEGYAPEVVMSNPAGEADLWLTDLCDHRRYSFEVSCFVPDPPTTQGEAVAIGDYAAQRDWRSIIVVTMGPHISRARYIVAKCFRGDLIMRQSPAPMSLGCWIYTCLYQTAGYLKAALHSGC